VQTQRAPYDPGMGPESARRTRNDIRQLAQEGLDWVTFSTEASRAIGRVISFSRACWHTVDPGTVLFTGSLNQNVGCSGAWLAEHEYVLEDVNKWWFLARSGRRAGATSVATHGDLSRSPRHRSHEAYGIGDELRGSFVADGTYWGAAGFLREQDEPWFTEDDVRFLVSLSEPLAVGLRRALVASATNADPPQHGPGVVVFDEGGTLQFISPAAERWIEQLMEVPPPSSPADSRILQIVAARARALAPHQDPLELTARCRAQTVNGSWLVVYGTRLSGGIAGHTAVILQPAPASEVAPLVALAYGLSERECQVAGLCIQGQSTKQMAETLRVSPYTIQDHLKSIFDKTGARTRGELVGQVFLEHYIPRWEELGDAPPGWFATALNPAAAPSQDLGLLP
jgi:DNA-binding CsgD family transcriptional regulator